MQFHSLLLDHVLTIAQEAGEHLLRFYSQKVKVQRKSDDTPVTEADLFVSHFLTEKLTALTPEIPILSEESADIPFAVRQQWKRYWLVDPLDGTQQFINHSGQFSVLIALIEDNQPILGVIHSPWLNKTYYAAKGQGAYKQEKGVVQILASNSFNENGMIRIAVGSKSAEKKVRSILNPNFQYQFYIYGSSGLKSTLVADNHVDCYIRLGQTGEWDTAAADILLAEIGGGIWDMDFNPLTYNQRATLINPDFIMVNHRLRDWKKILL